MNKERNAYVWLRKGILSVTPTARISRVENGVEDGMPDVNYCIRGIEGWIELKAPKVPRRPSTPLFAAGNHPLTLSQINWLLAHHQAGGRAWIGIYLPRHFLLLHANKGVVQMINSMAISAVTTLARASVTCPRDWSNLVNVLCTT